MASDSKLARTLSTRLAAGAMDPAAMAMLAKAPFVLVAESFNVKTGLGSRFGSELLKRGFAGRYNHIGVHRAGPGGLWQPIADGLKFFFKEDIMQRTGNDCAAGSE